METMADSDVKQQENHGEQDVDNERTDTKAEQRDDGHQTKTEEKDETEATQQKEEPPTTKQKEEPPVTKQEEPPATKQREDSRATKQREVPPPTRDEDRGGDMRDNQSESETTKGQSEEQSEGTKNAQYSNTKTSEKNTTKGADNTNKTTESPSRRNEDNQQQKNTKSVSKGGDSTKENTKASPKRQKSSPKKDTAKRDTKGSPDRKQEEGVKESEPKKRGAKGENGEQEKTEENSSDENSGKDTSRSSNAELSEGRTKQKEFFKLELQRLESSLKRESSKIMAPSKKPHTPYIFNTLEPYYNTQITRYLIELPDEMKHGHTSRRTAQGLTDPWVDLRMDRDILPKVPSKPVSRQVAILKREKEIRDRKKRSAVSQSTGSRKGGSTRLPKFPVVHLETQDLASKQLVYSDVPFLRNELKSKYSSSAKSKIDEDYKRTQQDFFRMELDKLDEVHPVNRRHMRSAYFAYLQNTPGSKKAITDCVRSLESGKAQ